MTAKAIEPLTAAEVESHRLWLQGTGADASTVSLEWMRRMLAHRDLLAAECEAWRTAWDGREDNRDGYTDPDHCHRVPGTWDKGGQCDSCVRFMEVEQRRQATDRAGVMP